MKIAAMRETELEQVTGCRYAALVCLHRRLIKRFPLKEQGRPFRHTIWLMLIVTLMKLRLEASFRTMEVITRIDAVTLSRYVRRVCGLLATLPLASALPLPRQFLVVDSTCSRVRSTDSLDYSGYKHHKNRKCQAVVDDRRRIIAVSRGFAGSVHDKTVWNKEFSNIKRLLDRPVLGDKAYAGGAGEDHLLFRPVKHNETRYREDNENSRAFNRDLSRWRVTVEHVFAQLKNFRILRGIFPFHADRYGECFRAIAVVYNTNLECKTK